MRIEGPADRVMIVSPDDFIKLEIDPTNPRWIDKLPSWTQLRRIPGLNHGALGSTIAEVKDLPLGKFVELSQTPPTGDPHWQVPARLGRPGKELRLAARKLLSRTPRSVIPVTLGPDSGTNRGCPRAGGWKGKPSRFQ